MNLTFVGAAGLVAAAVAAGSIAAEPAGPVTSGAVFELFSASEATAWNTTQPKQPSDFSTRDLGEDNGAPTCRSTPNNDADNPKIRVLAPPVGKTLIAPLDFNLQFVPTSNAPIRPDTFRVCYLGLIAMDITKRITDRVPVSETGIHMTVQLPHGHHRLLLLIADERGRLGRREADFDIE